MQENNIQIKRNPSLNVESTEAFLISIFGNEKDTVDDFIYRIKNNICTFTAYNEDNMIGLLTAWKNNFHPYCTYFALAINPVYGNEIAHKLLHCIEDNVIHPIQTTVWETSYFLKSFYEQAGFKEIRRTYMPRLNVAPINIQTYNNQLKPTQGFIYSLKDIEANHDLRSKLIHLVRDTYKKTHTANPVGTIDENQWGKLIFEDDTILEASYVILSNDDIVGFALLHASDMPKTLEFGWRGTKNVVDRSALLTLCLNQIKYAKDNQYEFIDAEIDTTDPFQIELMKHLPFAPAPTLITFQKNGV